MYCPEESPWPHPRQHLRAQSARPWLVFFFALAQAGPRAFCDWLIYFIFFYPGGLRVALDPGHQSWSKCHSIGWTLSLIGLVTKSTRLCTLTGRTARSRDFERRRSETQARQVSRILRVALFASSGPLASPKGTPDSPKDHRPIRVGCGP